MYFKRSTQVPNQVFDVYLKTLSEKELKVLLAVIRQTLGWVDDKGERKKRDWMSQKFLSNKTGLSPKSVSQAIDLLVTKNLIIATTEQGEELESTHKRKGQERIYYGLSETLVTFLPKTKVNITQDPSTNCTTTKLTYIKQKVTRSQLSNHADISFRQIGEVFRDQNNGQQKLDI